MSLQQEIQELKSQLTALTKQKELYFHEKEKLKAELKSKIQKLKQEQQTSKASQKEIRELKQERDGLNKEVQQLIHQLKKLNEKKESLQAKSGREDPSRILRQIKMLETKIETEALSTNKEKELMKQIKDLKKLHLGQKEITDVLKEISQLSTLINEKRKKADTLHNKLKELTGGKQSYQQLIDSSKELLELRNTQEARFQKFITAKQKCSLLNKQLKEKFSLLNAERKVLAENKKLHESRKRQRNEDILKEKEREVEEKLRTKKHLTHEDLLVFQRQ